MSIRRAGATQVDITMSIRRAGATHVDITMSIHRAGATQMGITVSICRAGAPVTGQPQRWCGCALLSLLHSFHRLHGCGFWDGEEQKLAKRLISRAWAKMTWASMLSRTSRRDARECMSNMLSRRECMYCIYYGRITCYDIHECVFDSSIIFPIWGSLETLVWLNCLRLFKFPELTSNSAIPRSPANSYTGHM